MMNYSCDKTNGAYRSGGGENILLSGLGSDLRPGREQQKEVRYHRWDEQKIK